VKNVLFQNIVGNIWITGLVGIGRMKYTGQFLRLTERKRGGKINGKNLRIRTQLMGSVVLRVCPEDRKNLG
jgi:ABC-type sugar transport system ATPase subunit